MDYSHIPMNRLAAPLSVVTLKHLRAFTHVALAGSFTRAAERMHQTQSSTTVLIRQLEEALGLRLLARTTRQVALTGAGREFLPTALRLTKDFDVALKDMRDFAGLLRGQVTIAAAPSVAVLLLPPLLRTFGERFPGVRIRVMDDTSRGVQRHVVTGEADLGLTGRHKPDQELEFAPVLGDIYGAVLPPGHQLAAGKGPLRWDALRGERCVGLSEDTGIGAFLRGERSVPEVLKSPFYEAYTTTSQSALVAAGLGVGILPALAAARAPISTLRFRPLTGPRLERAICTITHRARPLSPAAQAMVVLIGESLQRLSLPPGVRRLKR